MEQAKDLDRRHGEITSRDLARLRTGDQVMLAALGPNLMEIDGLGQP